MELTLDDLELLASVEKRVVPPAGWYCEVYPHPGELSVLSSFVEDGARSRRKMTEWLAKAGEDRAALLAVIARLSGTSPRAADLPSQTDRVKS